MKVIVEIDLPNKTVADYEQNYSDWHPIPYDDRISIDSDYLTVDPTDDSFYVFKLIEVVE